MDYSVIVPVYHESTGINSLIDHVRSLAGQRGQKAEIIVVDGSPLAETVSAIKRDDVKKMVSSPGRGTQMNAGAEAASGEVLVFLHADTRLPPSAFSLVSSLLEDPAVCGGAFDLGIDDDRKFYRVIERMANLRSRLTRIPYGDQTIFLRSCVFSSIGGYRNIPIFEDVDLMRRIKAAGLQLGFIDSPVVTSARRWQREGILRTTFRNWLILAGYFAGFSPGFLERFYRREAS
ncbi:MAG TPA: glycosyltransferase [Synergistetes bacterium]|nr:glycosyltransferase [Synergistota bacterium]